MYRTSRICLSYWALTLAWSWRKHYSGGLERTNKLCIITHWKKSFEKIIVIQIEVRHEFLEDYHEKVDQCATLKMIWTHKGNNELYRNKRGRGSCYDAMRG